MRWRSYADCDWKTLNCETNWASRWNFWKRLHSGKPNPDIRHIFRTVSSAYAFVALYRWLQKPAMRPMWALAKRGRQIP